MCAVFNGPYNPCLDHSELKYDNRFTTEIWKGIKLKTRAFNVTLHMKWSYSSWSLLWSVAVCWQVFRRKCSCSSCAYRTGFWLSFLYYGAFFLSFCCRQLQNLFVDMLFEKCMLHKTEIDQAFHRILDFYTCERRGKYSIFPSFSDHSDQCGKESGSKSAKGY